MEMTLYLPLIIISVVPYGFISTEGAPTPQTVENKDASICYSHHRTSDRSSIFRQTSCHGDHDLEVPTDSSIVTSLLNFTPDRHNQDVNERTVGTPCDGATEHRWLNMTQENSTTKERVNTADADVTHITTLAQHDTTKSTERPDTTKEGVKNQSMYWISNYTLTWFDAVDRCRQLFNNGHLVRIDNEEEKNEVKAIRYQANIGDVWIGIHDSEKEGEWKYEDGSPLTYVNWRNGEPSNSNNEDCAVMKYDLYNDQDCMEKLYFCCEYYLEDIIN
ncbi:uncharacterized protein [Apostichopus japonicus]|uniref:uncharacterized protein n=1 Tax=Stichopus japonicus TaxID=307972 RepID=UPI003AB7ADE0